MPASYSRVAWIMLVPALALAGPKDKTKKKKTDKAAEKKDDAKDAGSDAAKDAPKDAPKDESLMSSGTAGGTTPGGGASNGGSGSAAGGGSGSDAGSGSGSDSTKKDDKAPANEPDVDALRQEYLTLRDELYKSRARANAVASQLYSTRITIRFTWTTGRYYGVSKASVRLDGATVFEGTAIANDDGVRFDGYVAPGRHLVTFHVDASGKDDDSFTSSTESQVVVKAVAGKDLVVAAKGRDSGDIAYEWKKSEHGNYGLGIDVAVKTMKPAAGGDAAPAKVKK